MVSVKSLLDEVREALLVNDLFMYFVMLGVEFRFVDSDGFASTDGKRVYLYRGWVESDFGNRYAIVLHELGHIVLNQVQRALELESEYECDKFVNVCADAIVNHWLIKSDKRLSKYLSEWREYFGDENLDVVSFEELFLKYKDRFCKYGGSGGLNGNENLDIGVESEEGEVIQENVFEWDDVSDLVLRAYESVKFAGKGVSKFGEYLVDKLFESQVDWYDILIQKLIDYGESRRVISWYRGNRRDGSLPHVNAYGLNNLWVFVDVSFSISDDEFKRFFGELSGILELFDRVNVVLWSDGVVDVFDVSDIGELLSKKVDYRGGTDFCPVLDEFDDKVGVDDVVVVMSDGYWYRSCDVSEFGGLKILVTSGKSVGSGWDDVICVEGDGR